MTAKAKPLQVMVALTAMAVTYTVYQAASVKENGSNKIVVKSSSTVLPNTLAGKNKNASYPPTSKIELETADKVPGYSNPDDFSR